MLHPAERAAEALRFYRDYMANASDDEMVAFAFQSAPPAPFVPAHLHGAPVVGLALCPSARSRRASGRRSGYAPSADRWSPSSGRCLTRRCRR